MTSRGSVGLAVLAVGLWACGGGGGDGPTGPIESKPPALAVTVTPGYNYTVSLKIYPPPVGTGTWQYFELQARVADGAWQVLSDSIPFRPVIVGLDMAGAPEGVRYGFRVRCTSGVGDGLETTPWSGEVTFLQGVMSSPGAWVEVEKLPAVESVHWLRGSEWADTVRLERRVVSVFDGTSPWAEISIEPGQTGWEAPTNDYQDGSRIDYRITYAVGVVRSEPVQTSTGVAPPLPVTGLQALVEGRTVHLSWTNASRLPSYPSVTRHLEGTYDPEELVASLASGVTALDVPDQADGHWTYRVRTVRTDYPSSSEPALAAASIQEDMFVAGRSHLRALVAPSASRAAIGSAGELALARGVACPGGGGGRIWLEGGDELVLDVGQLLAPGVAFDSSGVAHAIQADGCTLRHWWNDGAWHDEELPAACPVGGNVGLDPAGALHLLVAGGDAHTLRHLTNAGGAWAIADEIALPDLSLPTPVGTMAFTPGGAPGFLVQDGQTLWLVRWRVGTWSAEAVPLEGGLLVTESDVPHVALPDEDRALVVTPGASWTVERGVSGWMKPEQVWGAGPVAAVSADGARAVYASKGSSNAVIIWEHGELTGGSPILRVLGGLEIGIGADGKWWLLDGLDGPLCGSDEGPLGAYAVYGEL